MEPTEGNTRKQSSHKKLIIVLVSLVVLIAGLIAGLVILNNQPKEEPHVETEAEKMERDVKHVNDVVNSVKEAYSTMSKEDFVEFCGQKFNECPMCTAKLFHQISQMFIDGNNDEELLEILLNVNDDMLDDNSIKYRFYLRMINLGTKLDRKDVVTKYQPLADEYYDEGIYKVYKNIYR